MKREVRDCAYQTSAAIQNSGSEIEKTEAKGVKILIKKLYL